MDDYSLALGKFAEYEEKRASQRKRGLNDANVFSTLLSTTDEVRLHSRFLRFLLDPSANHYQDDLFLRLFLDTAGINGIDTQHCRVRSEYKHIDIYISDGTNHIILENKLYASDQNLQIERYIDTIKEMNKDKPVSGDKPWLHIVFLSLGREPSSDSLGRFTLSGNFLTSSAGEAYPFHYLQYQTDIINWLEKVYHEIQNITNLAVIVQQYKDVILIVTGNYRSKVMTLFEFIESKDEVERQTILKTIPKMYSEYSSPTFIQQMMNTFFEMLIAKLRNKVQGWDIKLDYDYLKWPNKETNAPIITIFKNESKDVTFALGCSGKNYNWPRYGIRCENDEQAKELEKISGPGGDKLDKLTNNPSKNWPKQKYFGGENYNLYDGIIKEGRSKVAEALGNEMQLAFEDYEQSLTAFIESKD